MNITGIEVIRQNPSVVMGVVAGEKLPVTAGDTVRVHMTVGYRGNAIDGAIWTAIGWQVGIVIKEFVEVFNSRTPVHFAKSDISVTYPIVCDVPISAISGFLIEFGLYGNVLDMYAKIMEVPGPDIFTDIYMGAIEVVEAPPEYELVYTYDYPDAATYVGKAEVCPFTFVSIPEQIPGHKWLAEQLAKVLGESMIEHGEGSKMLRLQLWSDTSEALYTKYYGEATATASPVPWALVIGAIAIIAVIISFIVLIDKVKSIDWGKIPAPVTWGIAALVGGLGILAVGAALALATKRE